MTGAATALRLASQYARLAELLPGLITDLTASALTSTGREQGQAFALPSPPLGQRTAHTV
jgi:hypothetical protein